MTPEQRAELRIIVRLKDRIRELEAALREVQAHGYFTCKDLVDGLLLTARSGEGKP